MVYSDQEMGNLPRFGMGRISTGENGGIRIVPTEEHINKSEEGE